jgi:hypothetical protein
LDRVEQRAMVLAGGRDLVLPSEEESGRLVKRMQRAFAKVWMRLVWIPVWIKCLSV